MNINLFQGKFNTTETIDLLQQLFAVKIKFHENKIATLTNAEDIELQEKNIMSLQDNLRSIRHSIIANQNNQVLNCQINLA